MYMYYYLTGSERETKDFFVFFLPFFPILQCHSAINPVINPAWPFPFYDYRDPDTKLLVWNARYCNPCDGPNLTARQGDQSCSDCTCTLLPKVTIRVVTAVRPPGPSNAGGATLISIARNAWTDNVTCHRALEFVMHVATRTMMYL